MIKIRITCNMLIATIPNREGHPTSGPENPYQSQASTRPNLRPVQRKGRTALLSSCDRLDKCHVESWTQQGTQVRSRQRSAVQPLGPWPDHTSELISMFRLGGWWRDWVKEAWKDTRTQRPEQSQLGTDLPANLDPNKTVSGKYSWSEGLENVP